jgi:hypothetical protein
VPRVPASLPVTSAALAALVCLGALVGCSDSEPTPEDAACDARDALGEQVRQLADDVAAADLGQARDDLAAVRADYEDLRSDLGLLRTELRDELRPDVEALQAAMATLTGARSLDEIRTGLDAVTTAVHGIVDQVTTTLDCD